jgi:CRISPR-associated protein Cmr4
MKDVNGILFLYSESFLHPGAGTSSGVIDLPVQREAHTGYPMIAAAGLKGSLRDLAEKKLADKEMVEGIFGPEVKKGKDTGYAGALSVSDARLLALPVRSFTNTFFWVTSPLALERFARDLRIIGVAATWSEIKLNEQSQALVPENRRINGKFFCEELDFEVSPNAQVSLFAKFLADQFTASQIGKVYHAKLQQDIAVISDSDFSYLTRFGTQVSVRIKLTSRKTTTAINDGENKEEGNLWYEETLPPESIFYVPIFAGPVRGGVWQSKLDSGEKIIKNLDEKILADKLIQVGGNETLGQGLCLTTLLKGKDGEANE